ncbi:16S rRNA (guanine(966)-N(2))-methyltransferase RsmD [Frigoribacterium sp. RIT-PI-h]|jgi:16S rRNA (guanine966-N2)-methyltransferase|uniref:16S rRNA (guanine(966)-N(2))-methyltransferase RsmD n=1 Tax=Frigoribacterium sp. RIT-PI-h TaxID=1690245 RepID=UPI0006B893BE|nr:16S rRNA (guanine(966)-N(2))-methyltransferase RsmD [Frigoribacterium sp. RIT-PI-h]KPG85723.1 methyltransferase [Frigoribacterium sp. RIT-PI-h]
MSRIISGFADNLSLVVPKVGTRPTSDRVREALFSSLDARDEIRGRRVLDLYAGTGGLGLEAASRGAASVVLVEKAPAAAKVLRRNVESVLARAPRPPRGTPPRVDVVAQPVRSYLEGGSALVDLVFFDPPYELSAADLTADLTALLPSLDEQALVVVERASRDGEPGWPDGLTLDVKKQYGDTTVWFALRD